MAAVSIVHGLLVVNSLKQKEKNPDKLFNLFEIVYLEKQKLKHFPSLKKKRKK